MMNKEQFLLGKIAEEASEIIEVLNTAFSVEHYTTEEADKHAQEFDENLLSEVVDFLSCICIFQEQILGRSTMEVFLKHLNDKDSVDSLMEQKEDNVTGFLLNFFPINSYLGSIIKLCSKAQQFGHGEIYDEVGLTNWSRIMPNIKGFLIQLSWLISKISIQSFDSLDLKSLTMAKEEKSKKLSEYLEYSKTIGKVNEDVYID